MIECLKDCAAACCKNAKYFMFGLDEVKLLRDYGGILIEGDGVIGKDGRRDYEMQGVCVCLDGGKCMVYENRPKVCHDFRVSSRECLRFRAENEVEVINRTAEDEAFQEVYFGWVERD